MASNKCERILDKSDVTNADFGSFRFPYSTVLLYPALKQLSRKKNRNTNNLCRQQPSNTNAFVNKQKNRCNQTSTHTPIARFAESNCSYRQQKQQQLPQNNCMNSQLQNNDNKQKAKCNTLYNNLLKFPLTKGSFCTEMNTNEWYETPQVPQRNRCQTPNVTNNMQMAACSSRSAKHSAPRCSNANCPYRKQLEMLLDQQNFANTNELKSKCKKTKNDTTITCRAFDFNLHQFPLTKGWLFPTVRESDILITPEPKQQTSAACFNGASQQTLLCPFESEEEIDETEYIQPCCHQAMQQMPNHNSCCATNQQAEKCPQPSVNECCMARLKQMASEMSTLCGHCGTMCKAPKTKTPIKKKQRSYSCLNKCPPPPKPKRKIIKIQTNKLQVNNCACNMCQNAQNAKRMSCMRTSGGCNVTNKINRTVMPSVVKPKINIPKNNQIKIKVQATNATCNSSRQKSGADTVAKSSASSAATKTITKPNACLQHLKKRQKFANVSKDLFHKLLSRFQRSADEAPKPKITVNVNVPTATVCKNATTTKPYQRKRLPSVQNKRFQDVKHIPAPGWEPKRIARALSPPKTITSSTNRRNLKSKRFFAN